MRAKFREIRINENLKPELIFTLNRLADNTVKLKGKIVDIEIKEAKDKRSINANNYYWSLVDILKSILGLSETETHLHLLAEYGTGEPVQVRNEAVDSFRRLVKYSIIKDKGTEWTTIKVLKGSSDMDTAEFAKLLEGTISEAKEQGIPILEDEIYKELMEE